MLVLGLFFAAVTAFSIFLVAAPAANGRDPLWGALVLTIGGTAGWRCPSSGRAGSAGNAAFRIRARAS